MSSGSRIAAANAARSASPTCGSRPGGATSGRQYGLAGKSQLQHLPVSGVGHELVEQRHCGQLLVLSQAALHEDLEPAGCKIIPVADPRDTPGIPHDAVELAALDGMHEFQKPPRLRKRFGA